jgi:hypothetical protein
MITNLKNLFLYMQFDFSLISEEYFLKVNCCKNICFYPFPLCITE